MKENGLALDDPAEQGRCSRVRHGRTYSNSVWRTAYKLPDDGRRRTVYRDDASRFITGYGAFAHATGRHTTRVQHKVTRRYGRPASILTGMETRFYASESESRRKGTSEFEQELVKLGIRQILARANHLQTNGELERFHGELQYRPGHFGTINRLVRWWNKVKPYKSLDWDSLKMPARAFVRKMPARGTVVKDEQTGGLYDIV